MIFLIKHFLLIFVAVTVLVGIAPGSAFSLLMTIDAIEDAGQFPGEGAYLRFVYTSTNMSGSVAILDTDPPWTSRDPADEFANKFAEGQGITEDDNYKWYFESAGNIWSPDTMAGDALDQLNAGIYRISVAGGAFKYDSFDWSPYSGQWRWQLQIQAREFEDGKIVDYHDYILGFFGLPIDYYATEFEALQSNLGKYIDIPVNEGGSLNFWIWDTNSIDNSGRLSFKVVLIPEPSTFILTGTGLLLLLRRYRKYISAH